MKFRFLPLLLLWVTAGTSSVLAKCTDRKAFYCVPVIFKFSDPKLKKADQFPGHCAGFVDLNGMPTPVIFQDKGECPAKDTPVSGHLISICQDTGEWTKATYWFAHKPFFCGVSYDQRRDDARKLAARIYPRKTTRAQVRELLKEYEYIGAGFSAEFVEQYYGHPNTLIEVPFKEPGGQDETVSGRATIADIDMPRP